MPGQSDFFSIINSQKSARILLIHSIYTSYPQLISRPTYTPIYAIADPENPRSCVAIHALTGLFRSLDSLPALLMLRFSRVQVLLRPPRKPNAPANGRCE